MKRSLLFLIFVLVAETGWSQLTSTAQRLRLARSTYEQGRLHEIPELVSEIIKSGDKSEKVDAYVLLCQSYIYLEEPEKADDAMLNLLRTDPYFKPNPDVDPAEFVALYKTFRTLPIFRIGGLFGVNATWPNVSSGVESVNLTSDSKYTPKVGISFGVTGDVPLNERMDVHGEIVFVQRSFGVQENVLRGYDVNNKPLYNQFSGTESQTWIGVPLTFQYQFLNPKSKLAQRFKPYVSAGAQFDYFLSSNLATERTRDDQSSIQKQTFDMKPSREKINMSAVLGVGLKIRIGGGYLVPEVRWCHGFTPVSSKATSYSNDQLTFNTGYADPIFKINSIGLNMSYVQNIFNPKKKHLKK